MRSSIFIALSLFAVQSVTSAQTYYVDPDNGLDTYAGTSTGAAFKTIAKARDAAKAASATMAADIIINLRGGRHVQTSTLVFDQSHSGANGYNVVYQAYSGETPVISGGRTITGWVRHGSSNRWKAGCTLDNFRSLWVNGVKAIRAKGGELPGATTSDNGHTTSDNTMQRWRNPSDIEFVYEVEWSSSRCGVAGIAGTAITMKQPGYGLCRSKRGVQTEDPTWIENAFELLDASGEWYLDRSADTLYYIPRTGENMATAEVIAPQVEKLVDARGTIANPIHNIQFKGLIFSHSTWLAPSGNNGLPDIQGIWAIDPANSNSKTSWLKPMASVNFEYASDLAVLRCVFTRLGGGVALGFDNGSRNNLVDGNDFSDCSGTGIAFGNVFDYNPSDTRQYVENNIVSNNYLVGIGNEYRSGVGIFAGYVKNHRIIHNTIRDIPYTGISVGWGWTDWGSSPGYSGNNVINYNRIENFTMVLTDGGGIYTLNRQPGSEMKYNYIKDQVNEYSALYYDEGTTGYTGSNNVCENIPSYMHLNTSLPNTLDSTYTTTNDGDIGTHTFYYPTAKWPAIALRIIAEAGRITPSTAIASADVPRAMPLLVLKQKVVPSLMSIYSLNGRLVGTSRYIRTFKVPAFGVYITENQSAVRRICR